jgi:hypothetical protein
MSHAIDAAPTSDEQAGRRYLVYAGVGLLSLAAVSSLSIEREDRDACIQA